VDGRAIPAKIQWYDRPDVRAHHPAAPEKAGFLILVDLGGSGVTNTAELHMGDATTTISAPSPEYTKFIRQCWAHFTFVRDHFPALNPTSKSVGDLIAKPNSPEELITIANHLFLLKNSGVYGSFAEFGCFKGYSTSMLSYACRLLGIEMHVFDSFEGLPPSDSDYLTGEFAGSLDEVRSNVERYGAPEMVIYHKGFFSESLPKVDLPRLISLWMDVDLESSANDVMSIFGKIHAKGAIFSHECYPEAFEGEIHQHPGSANVIYPILSAYRREGVKPLGFYVSGNTGCFWRPDGIPVTPLPDVLKIARG
jgi:hypothetical protein